MQENSELLNEQHSPQGEELNPAEPNKTALQQKQELQAMQRKSIKTQQNRPDTNAQIVGAGAPSNRRHHPQRQNREGHNK